MLKRIIFAFFIAVAFPLIYILIGQKQDWTADDTISDDNQNNYTCFHNSSDIMIVKTDSNSEICGKWITQHSYGYNFTNVEAMTAYDGNFYCVLTEINSKNFMIVQRKWLKIDFENNTADILYNLKYNGIQNAYSTSLTVSDGRMYTVSALLEGIQIVDVYNKRQKILNPGIEAIVNYAAALPDGRIIFTDILNRIYIMEQDGDPAMIYETSPGSFSQCTVDNNGYCYIYDLNNGWLVSSNNYYTGKINFINSDVFKDSFTSSVSTGYNKNFIIFCVVGIAAGVIIFIILSLKRISILLKISGIIVLSLGIGGIILFLFIDSIMEKVYLQSKLDRAVMSAKVIEANIDMVQFAEINWNHPGDNKYFYELCSFFEYTDGNDKIKAVIDNNHSSEIILDDNNYCCLYILDNEGIKSGICDEHPVNIPIENIESEVIADVYKSVAAGESESIMYGAYADDFEWVLAISPLKDKNGMSGHRNKQGCSTPVFRNQFVFRQFLFDTLHVGARLINLVNGNDNFNTGRLCMTDGLYRLRHNAIIGSNYQNRNIRRLGATQTHSSERFMSRSIEESNFFTLYIYHISANMLSDTAGLSCSDMGITDSIQNGRFTVVNMAHNTDYRWSWL